MLMLIMLILFIISLVGLMRSVLIVLGMYKEPILYSFEQYGPEERLPMPLLTLTVWAGAFITTVSVWSSVAFGVTLPLAGLGILLMIAGGVGLYYYDAVAPWYYKIVPFPRWHRELLDRTTRYERRRIAYMWLYLSRRLRLTYNSNDSAFFNWADFVIMGTIREEEGELYDEGFYMGQTTHFDRLGDVTGFRHSP